MFKNASHAPSFEVIVSCYKPSRSILNFFELLLKAYTRRVPNRTDISRTGRTSPLYAASFTPCGQGVKILSQETKGPISLSATIADMCIPSQIICDSDPKILDTCPFDIFKDCSLQSI